MAGRAMLLGRSRSCWAQTSFALLGLLFTTQAAPIMLHVAELGDDAEALRTAFEGFFFWSAIRGVCQLLAFLTNLIALSRFAPRATQETLSS